MGNSAWIVGTVRGNQGGGLSKPPTTKPTPKPPLWLVPKGSPSGGGIGLPANDNFRPSSSNALRLGTALRGAGRLLPYVGIAITLWELFEAFNADDPYGFTFNGPWSLDAQCGSQLPYDIAKAWRGTAVMCATNQIKGSPNYEWGSFNSVPASWTQLIRGNRHNVPLERYQTVENWSRPADGKEAPLPDQVRVMPFGPPAVPGFPEISNPLIPQQLPSTDIPYSQIPNIPDSQFRETSYGEASEPVAPPVFHPGPPGPGVTEKKLRTPYPVIVNILTEGVDAIEAIWEAIPPEHRFWRNPTPQGMVQDIYYNWDHIDWEQVVWNLVANEIEDRAIGAFMSGFGPDGPPLGLQQALNKVRNELRNRKEEEDE